jgi:Protein of unknown function (DUF3761)
MKNITVAALVAAPLLMLALAVPSFAADPAPTTCKDGTTSTSTGKGTCSGHGGIQKAAKAKPATAATAPAPAAAAPAATPAAPAAAAPAAAGAAKSSTATKSAPTASAGNTDPTGATAKCKDGTYSKSAHRSGTCSSHGGVAEWLTAAK